MSDLSVIPDRMIADLTEMGAFAVPQLEESRKQGILRHLLGRIEGEPARVVTNIDGEVVGINPAFSALCGFTFEEIRGRKPGSLLQGPDTTAESIEVLREGIRSRVPCEVEMVNYHKDKSAYRVHIELTPLCDRSGNHVGFQATERKLS